MASLYKRNGVWYVAVYVNGRRVYRSTKTTRKPDALRFLSQFHDTSPKPRVASFSAFLQDFLAFSQSNHAPSSYRCYKRVCRDFLSFVGNVPLDAIRPVDIEKFKIARLKTIKPVSVNIELRMLKAAFGYAVKWGLTEKSPFKGASFVRIPQQQPAFLVEGDIRKLLEVVGHPHFRDIILFAINTGMRRGEIVNLRWENVDFEHRVITVTSGNGFRTKTGRLYRIPMNETVFQILQGRDKTTEYVFCGESRKRFSEGYVTRRFKAYVRLAGLPESIHFHSLRHTFASTLARMGVPLFDIQKLLNHSQISTTMVYSHLMPDHLRASVERLTLSMN